MGGPQKNGVQQRKESKSQFRCQLRRRYPPVRSTVHVFNNCEPTLKPTMSVAPPDSSKTRGSLKSNVGSLLPRHSRRLSSTDDISLNPAPPPSTRLYIKHVHPSASHAMHSLSHTLEKDPEPRSLACQTLHISALLNPDTSCAICSPYSVRTYCGRLHFVSACHPLPTSAPLPIQVQYGVLDCLLFLPGPEKLREMWYRERSKEARPSPH